MTNSHQEEHDEKQKKQDEPTKPAKIPSAEKENEKKTRIVFTKEDQSYNSKDRPLVNDGVKNTKATKHGAKQNSPSPAPMQPVSSVQIKKKVDLAVSDCECPAPRPSTEDDDDKPEVIKEPEKKEKIEIDKNKCSNLCMKPIEKPCSPPVYQPCPSCEVPEKKPEEKKEPNEEERKCTICMKSIPTSYSSHICSTCKEAEKKTERNKKPKEDEKIPTAENQCANYIKPILKCSSTHAHKLCVTSCENKSPKEQKPDKDKNLTDDKKESTGSRCYLQCRSSKQIIRPFLEKSCSSRLHQPASSCYRYNACCETDMLEKRVVLAKMSKKEHELARQYYETVSEMAQKVREEKVQKAIKEYKDLLEREKIERAEQLKKEKEEKDKKEAEQKETRKKIYQQASALAKEERAAKEKRLAFKKRREEEWAKRLQKDQLMSLTNETEKLNTISKTRLPEGNSKTKLQATKKRSSHKPHCVCKSKASKSSTTPKGSPSPSCCKSKASKSSTTPKGSPSPSYKSKASKSTPKGSPTPSLCK